MNVEELQTRLRDEGVFAVAESLLKRSREPCEGLKLLAQSINDLYWKAKDVRAALQLGICGASYAMTVSPNEASRGIAKQIAYNLASFAWPGWAEPGITLNDSDIAIGFDAARLNLRLAIELNRPLKGVANAHWMMGAYAIVHGRTSKAIAEFTRASMLNEQAQEHAMALMNQAYAALAALVADPTQSEPFDRTIADLAAEGSDDAKFFVEQLQTARKVFCEKPGN